MTIPDELIEHPQLTRLAVVFYLRLRKIAVDNIARVSYKYLKISSTMGSEYSEQLERAGFIMVTRDKGRGHFNEYRIIK